MNDIIQNLEVNATNGKENFCYISEKQLNAMKELSKREAKENKQLKDNWNLLEKWLETNWKESQDIWFVKIINKMQELEQGDLIEK